MKKPPRIYHGFATRKTIMTVALAGLFAGQFSSHAFAATGVDSGAGGVTSLTTAGAADTLTITATAGTSVSNDLTVGGNLSTTGSAAVAGGATISGATNVNTTGTATTTIGNASSLTDIGGALNVTGPTTATTITSAGTANINTTGTAATTIGNVNSLTKIDGTLDVTGPTTATAITSVGAANINTTGTAASRIGNSNAATTIDLTGGASSFSVNNAAATIANGMNSIAVSDTGNTVVGTTNINTTGTAASRIGNNNAATTVDLVGGASSLTVNNLGNTMATFQGGSMVTTGSLASMSMTGAGAGSVTTSVTGTDITGATNTNTSTRANTVAVNGDAGTSILAGATQGSSGAMNIVMKGTNGAAESVASLTLTNGIGNVHGIQVYEDRTRISGGVNSTQLMMNENDVVFSHVASGAPVPVRGVADGTTDFDAVNYRQLKNAKYGIASTAAMVNIPQVEPGKTFSLGAGVGTFDRQSALAVGMSYRLAPSAVLKASVATAGRDRTTYGVGTAISW